MPRQLRAAWQAWKRIAQRIAHFQSQVLFGLLYFVVVAPFAIGLKLFSDPLRIKHKSAPSWWREHPRQTLTLEDAHRQS
ncbi:MAG: hypothetical protein HYY35_06915 [Deltaproteobacteria bacterium]|nr:hypothetical protein [Deltaproteobacteria bacterium]